MKRLLAIICVLALCAVCSSCFAWVPVPVSLPDAAAQTPAPTPEPTPELTPSPTPEPTPTPTPPPTLLGETEDMGQDYLDSIVFYGDSNTNALRLYGLLSGEKNTFQVWTPMSGTLTLCNWNVNKIVYPETWTEMDVTEAMALKKPEYLIINLGTNGISFMGQELFTDTYTEMTEALMAACPDTKIILCSVYPVADGYLGKDITNAKIESANEWIYGIAEKEGLRYLDVHSILIGPDGDLPEHDHIGDGYHITCDSQKRVLEYIRTHGYQ